MKVCKSPGGAVRRMRTSLDFVIYRPPRMVYARIRLTRVLRISGAKTGSNLFHQKRAISWLMSIPRSRSRCSTLRSASENRTYNHRKANGLRGRLEETKWGALYHSAKLDRRPTRLKSVSSDKIRRGLSNLWGEHKGYPVCTLDCRQTIDRTDEILSCFKTLQYQATPECIGLSRAVSEIHRPDGNQTTHALPLKFDHSGEADHHHMAAHLNLPLGKT